MDTVFDFGNVVAPKGTESLVPGQYVVESIDTELVETGKTPYLKTMFYNGEGKRVIRNFFITPKALMMLQYMHEQIMGKPIAKAFNSVEAVATYFTKIFEGYSNKKTPNRVGMIVGRKIAADAKQYSNLIDFGFLVNLTEDKTFEEREFSEQEIKTTKGLEMIDTYKGEQTSESGTFLNSSSAPTPSVPDYGTPVTAGDTDDLPF